MRLNILPARTGLLWARLGLQTFMRQPLVFTGLFFIFMFVLSLLSLIQTALSLVVLPAATLGLMAASREASESRLPKPSILLSAFRVERPQLRAMGVLGLLYAAGFLSVMGLSTLIDGGEFAKLLLGGGQLTPELIESTGFQNAMLITTVLLLPLSMLFWHAPALVHWHYLPPVKSLFFSLVACLRNWRAFLVYGAVWVGVIFATRVLSAVFGLLLGSPAAAAAVQTPVVLFTAAVFFTSQYFSFRDCFSADDTPAP